MPKKLIASEAMPPRGMFVIMHTTEQGIMMKPYWGCALDGMVSVLIDGVWVEQGEGFEGRLINAVFITEIKDGD